MGASDELAEQVKQGAIEVAFLALPTTARVEGVHARELARDRLMAVVRVEYVIRSRASRTPAATAFLTMLGSRMSSAREREGRARGKSPVEWSTGLLRSPSTGALRSAG